MLNRQAHAAELTGTVNPGGVGSSWQGAGV